MKCQVCNDGAAAPSASAIRARPVKRNKQKIQNMEQKIDCFLPEGGSNELEMTIASLKASPLVGRIVVMQTGESQPADSEDSECVRIDSLRSSATMRQIAAMSKASFTLIYLKSQYLSMGYLALERMVRVAEDTQAGMVYADHYQTSAAGERTEAPVIDYQQGSLRDDFDFGSVLLLRTSALRKAAARMTDDYKAAGLYDLRLKLSEQETFVHIPECLYSEVELDNRKTGEKLFDYVDPRNRDAQIEMEKACTAYLKDVGGYLEPEFRSVPLQDQNFEYEASIMIPVRNRIRTIRDAIDSALSQRTTFRYNIFVVENGPDFHSTDGTTEAIDAYDDERIIHLIPDRNDIGVGGSWNMAVHHPQCGRFIVQLDSDDVYSGTDTLQKIVEAFYDQQCAMVIGSYMLTDIDLNVLPPGKIDHREWTHDNGRNNALRINGLGAPRAFFTPVMREINLPNVNYGEDYALGLAISRHYAIGRIYDVLYNCRRWDDNSDGNLSIEKNNRNNLYKDRIRTWELQARIKMNSKSGEES